MKGTVRRNKEGKRNANAMKINNWYTWLNYQALVFHDTCIHIAIRTHTQTDTHIYKHTHAYVRSGTDISIHTHTQTGTSTYTLTNMNKNMHIHTHIHTHTYAPHRAECVSNEVEECCAEWSAASVGEHSVADGHHSMLPKNTIQWIKKLVQCVRDMNRIVEAH